MVSQPATLSSILANAVATRREAPDEAIRGRTDVNVFAEHCFTDDQGAFFRQGKHHRLLHEFRYKTKRGIIWFPIEHGKTQQAKVALLHELGLHPSYHYAYVSSTTTQAEKLVGAVAREIIKNNRLREVFPHLSPQRSAVSRSLEQWGSSAIRIEGCPPGSKDPSLAAYGIDGQILGSRLHGIIVDNVLDRNNTQTKLQRDRVLETLQHEVLSRLLRGGWIMIIDTAWHIDDALHKLSRRPGWDHIKLDAEEDIDGEDTTLWPAQWPMERLQERKAEIGRTAYDRTLRNKALSASLDLFKQIHLDSAMSHEVPWLTSYTGPGPVCTGVDLAVKQGEENDETSFFTARLDQQSMRYVVMNVLTKRMGAPAIIKMMLEIYRRFHATIPGSLFMVENNAAQDYLLQIMKDWDMFSAAGGSPAEFQSIQLRGFATTVKKYDLEFGIPSLAADFEMGRWSVPDHEETREWYQDMIRWSPDAHTGDRLMASWFCREGLRTPLPNIRPV